MEKSENNPMILDDTDRLLSIEEVAKRLRTSQTFVKRLITAELLGAIRFNSHSRIPKTALNRFIQEHINENLCDTLKSAEAGGFSA